MTEPEMPMVERVAAAILASGEGCLSGAVYADPRVAAVAAIQAMRIPTDQSIIAAEEWYRKSKTDRTWDKMFTVMVDAMLEEDEA